MLLVPLHDSLPLIDQRKTHGVYPKRGKSLSFGQVGMGGRVGGHESTCVLGWSTIVCDECMLHNIVK